MPPDQRPKSEQVHRAPAVGKCQRPQLRFESAQTLVRQESRLYRPKVHAQTEASKQQAVASQSLTWRSLLVRSSMGTMLAGTAWALLPSVSSLGSGRAPSAGGTLTAQLALTLLPVGYRRVRGYGSRRVQAAGTDVPNYAWQWTGSLSLGSLVPAPVCVEPLVHCAPLGQYWQTSVRVGQLLLSAQPTCVVPFHTSCVNLAASWFGPGQNQLYLDDCNGKGASTGFCVALVLNSMATQQRSCGLSKAPSTSRCLRCLPSYLSIPGVDGGHGA